MPIACDLDGVLRLGPEPIPGAADAVARLRDAGERIVFVTNNAAGPIWRQEERLAAMGVPAEGDVIGAGPAAASLVSAGERVFVIGEGGLLEPLAERGAVVVEDGPIDAVLVGLDRSFDYAKLRTAALAIRAGARFIAANEDVTYPTPDGLVPGAGSIVASVAAASGVAPTVAGKPHRPIADLVLAALGPTGLVIGDRDDTDGAFARTLGYRFALVFSGVTTPDEIPTDPAPDLVAADLAELTDQILATRRERKRGGVGTEGGGLWS